MRDHGIGKTLSDTRYQYTNTKIDLSIHPSSPIYFCLFESRKAPAAAAWHGLEENAAAAKRAESPVAPQ